MTNDKPESKPVCKAEKYRDYLGLEKILAAQSRISVENDSPVHDELLFIVLHQTIELWFLQILAEVQQAHSLIDQGDPEAACEELERIIRIFAVLISTWDVMASLRPYEFWRFRPYFDRASGFQSVQFRQLEIALGLRRGAANVAKFHLKEEKDSAAHAKLLGALDQPSLWDAVNQALVRAGFELPAEIVSRPVSEPYPYPRELTPAELQARAPDDNRKIWKGCPQVEDAWFAISQSRKDFSRSGKALSQSDRKFRDFYRLGERLLDLDAAFGAWREKHVATVERFLGDITGTGGMGVDYLRRTLSKRAFPELWSVRDRFDKLVPADHPA